MRPLARRRDLDVTEAGDELLVLDTSSVVAHRLNPTAAAVFRHADGTRTVDDLADMLTTIVSELADRDLVVVALGELEDAGLLEEGPRDDTQARRLSRRRFIRRVGVVGTAALVLPVVHSLSAPSPAAAQSAFCSTGPIC